jgi:two-component system phosphate regulon sensor histidine kinase PhoR
MPRSTASLILSFLLPALIAVGTLLAAGTLAGRLGPVGVVVVVAAGLVPALTVAWRIARRLERIGRFARAVAAGDFSIRLPAGERGGLGLLEEALNEMGERLARSFQAMREESERVQGILRAMIEGVVVIARTGEVILINQHAEELFDLPEGSDHRGRHLIEMCRDPELQELLRETIATGVQKPMRELMLAGGERRHLSVSVSPLGEAPVEPFGFVLVFHDITELKRLEAMRRDFVANVSHELRTPLTAIRGYAETLLFGALEDRRRARQFLAVIDRHAERLSRLIDDLLALSDLELGKTPLKREAVQLESLVDEAIEVLGEKAARGRVTLTKAIPADLPLLVVDGDRLQQVLINLTDNAVKYTPVGGRVTISAQVAGNGPAPVVDVEVSDTGIGIPAEDLPRLTERFYRVDKARSRELGGTGLGLAIVKHIVQAHGGRLHIASRLNVGTTVRFSVPAVPVAARERGGGA